MNDTNSAENGTTWAEGADRRASVNTSVHDSPQTPYYVSDDAADWLRDEGLKADSVVRMERIRRENAQTWATLLSWASKGSRKRVRLLRLIVEYRTGIGYDRLADQLDVSKRRVKTFVGELRDEGIVETPGRPAKVLFTDDDTELLAKDAAAFL